MSDGELRAGADTLVRKVRRYRPRVLAVLGVGAYRVGFEESRAKLGPQLRAIGTTAIWVLPNPSRLNAQFDLSRCRGMLSRLSRDDLLTKSSVRTYLLSDRDMKPDVVRILEEHGIKRSAQRVAIAEFVLHTTEHPSADRVWAGVQENFPIISRATVYNTLHLFVKKGLLRELHLAPDSVLFDPNTDRHHHFIDEGTGRIYDIPWNQVETNAKPLPGFEVDDYQVVMRGRRRRARR